MLSQFGSTRLVDLYPAVDYTLLHKLMKENVVSLRMRTSRVMLRYCSTLMSEELAGKVKVFVIGNGCVGKTSIMIRQFCKG